MCRQKPNGSARIILNFSAPKGASVNDGICNDNFPTTMSSTKKWLEVLDKAGKGALMAKLDWASAYKHIAVRLQDIDLQYFNWLGMDFVELCLVFGCHSSAGLYDRLAKVVLSIVLLYSKFPADMVCQYLDDVCAAAGSTDLHKFQQAYREIAQHLGVLLTPTTDPDKAFEPTTHGAMLGVYYDTIAWTWKIPEEKLARLLQQIRSALSTDRLQLHDIWSLVGRILHYAPLVPGGKFNISELIKHTGRLPTGQHGLTSAQLSNDNYISGGPCSKPSTVSYPFRPQTGSQPGQWSSTQMQPPAPSWPQDMVQADTVANSGFTSRGVTELTAA